MAYTINKTDGTVVATITDGTVDTSTSLQLFGKSYSTDKSSANRQGTIQSNDVPEKASNSQFIGPFLLVCFSKERCLCSN